MSARIVRTPEDVLLHGGQKGDSAMFTNNTQLEANAPSTTESVVARGLNQVQQFICGLHGHDALLHFEGRRMSLQCTSCGYETPGWDLNKVSDQAEVQPATRQIRWPLLGERRVA